MRYPKATTKEELTELRKNLEYFEILYPIPNAENHDTLKWRDCGVNGFLLSDSDSDNTDIIIAYGKGSIDMFNDSIIREFAYELPLDKNINKKEHYYYLYFEDGLTKIAPDTFAALPIQHCLLSETLEEIGEEAFYECNKLKELILPDGLKYIRKYAFAGCTELTYLRLPDTVEVIEEGAFAGCKKLHVVVMPSSLKSVDKSVFEDCGEMRIYAYMQKDSLAGAPWGNDNALVLWENDDGVFTSDDGTILYKVPNKITQYKIPDGIKAIGRQAVNYSKIKKIDIPDSVEKIGGLAFEYSETEEINIGKGVKEIEIWAFMWCKKLKSVDIPVGVKSLKSTFAGCISLEKVSLPNSLKKLESVFGRCYSLKKLYIPESVEEMSGDNFSFAYTDKAGTRHESSIESLEVDKNNPYFVSENGMIYSKNKEKLVCATTISGKSFTVPECVKEIDNCAFCANIYWDKIIIPKDVEIEENGGGLFDGNVIDYVEIPASLCKETIIFDKCKIKQLVIKGKVSSEKTIKKITYNSEIDNVIFE